MEKRTPLMPDCEHCRARTESVFAELLPNELPVLSGGKICRFYGKGEMIFYSGDDASGLYCLHDGKVKLYRAGNDGKEQIVRLAKAGDILGYRSLISRAPFSVYAQALEDSHACFIPRGPFFALLHGSQDLSMRVLQLLSGELDDAERRIVEMAQKPVRERLAETLLLLKETYGVDRDSATLSTKLTRQELASMVGTTPESVIRLLSDFKKKGMIDTRGRSIRLLDANALSLTANLAE